MPKKLYLLFGLAVVVAMLVASCGGATPAPAPTEAPAAEEAVAEEPMEGEGEAVAEEAEEEMAEEEAMEEEPMEEEVMEEEPAADTSGVTELSILWAEWDPANYLAALVQDYEAVAGVKVTVAQEPWGTFLDRVSAEWAARGDAFDMVVGDSQWLGQGASQGHYYDMTDFLNSTGLAESVTEATMKYYGEYPADSGQYWAFPTEGDADGWAYRTDLLEDPDEMAAFEAEYGYAYNVPPATWAELMDISKFFTRPDEGLYGSAIYTQKDYDALTMGYENVMFSYGADWAGPGNQVLGVVNSPEAVAASEYYRELYECCQPPGAGNIFFAEVNDYFVSGQVAMAMNYFAFFPSLANPATNEYSDVTGFFANPAGPDGDRFAALGGQGMSINSDISPERIQASKDFIEWFGQEDVQAKWALLGGYTCNKKVLASDEFLAVAPFNPAFAETMQMVKDFWNVPVYGELLEVVQRELHAYVVGGEGEAQAVMDAIAEQHDVILAEAGLQDAAAAEAPAEEEPVVDTSGVTELSILWAEWDPANYLAALVQDYEAVAGVKVTVAQEPWGTFLDRVSAEWAARGDAFDMVVGDSQWLGQGASQGHYYDMTDFLNSTGLAESVTEATMKYYGEYPADSGQYWAFPTEGDADGWAYRTDLLEDPDEMAAFEAEYGYAYSVPPATWAELMDISKFFTRPDEGLYGSAIYTQKDYDALTMGYENVMFSYGADWAGPGNQVLGVVNSPEAVAASEYYRELYECCQPPGAGNIFFAEVNDYFVSGQVAMAMNYFAFFPSLANPATNEYSDVTGFFANPAGPDGDRFAALGGQGMSINSYISPERIQASKDFIEWFGQEDVQAKWALLGGYTCNKKVLASDEFLAVAPFNPAFAETMQMVKDFWNVPVYGELLEVVQRELHAYVVGGEGEAQAVMDAIAEQHDVILRDAGLITE